LGDFSLKLNFQLIDLILVKRTISKSLVLQAFKKQQGLSKSGYRRGKLFCVGWFLQKNPLQLPKKGLLREIFLVKKKKKNIQKGSKNLDFGSCFAP